MSKAAQKAARVAAAKRSQTKKTIITIAIIVAVLILLTPLAMFSTGSIYRVATALTVNGQKYSAADFNYYYNTSFQTAYTNIYNSYGEYASVFVDPSKPLDEQQYSDTQTWADYIKESALNNIENIRLLNDAAAEEGFALNEEEEATLASVIDGTYAAAAEYGYSETGYLQAVYGPGMTAERFEQLAREAYTAERFANAKAESFTYSAEEIEAEFASDPNTYEFVAYRLFNISGAAAEGEDAAAAMTAAKADAEKMIARLAAGEDFADVAYDMAPEASKASYENDSATLATNATFSSVSTSNYGEWLFDADRAEGDSEIFEQTSGYTVIQFVGREDNLYNARDFRNILIAPEAAEDGTVTAEAKAAALAKAQEVLDAWNAGEKTAEAFGALADEHTTDASGNAGGLYENTMRNQMVIPVNDWVFDAARVSGDVELIESEYGYHILYFVGENGQVRDQLIQSTLRGADYTAWTAEREANYVAQTSSFGYRLAGNVR